MPVLICLREKLWTRTYYIGDQVPTCPVFTRAKIKVPFWDFSQFRVTKWINSSIWPIDRTLTGTTTSGQSEPESNDNEGVFHSPQSFRIVVYHIVLCYIQDTRWVGVLPLCRDAVGIFYSLSRLSCKQTSCSFQFKSWWVGCLGVMAYQPL